MLRAVIKNKKNSRNGTALREATDAGNEPLSLLLIEIISFLW